MSWRQSLVLLACLTAAAAEMDADEPAAALPQPSRVHRAVPAAAKRASSKPAQVQFVITNAMRAELTRLGYSEADMDERSPAALTAERAKAIIDYGIRRPTRRELPRSWTRAGQQRQGGLLSSKLLAPGTVLTAGAIAWATCAVDPACLRGLQRVSRKALRTLSKVASQYI